VSQIPNWILSSESSSGTGDCRNAAPTVVGCSVLNWFLTNRLTRQLFPTLESPSCGQASGGAGEPAGRARARGQLRANTSLHSVVLGAAIPPCAQAGEEFRRRRDGEKKNCRRLLWVAPCERGGVRTVPLCSCASPISPWR